MLRGRYLRRSGHIQHFFQLNRRLKVTLKWLVRYHTHRTISNRLIYWMVHICLQQFYIDVL